jgi:hypothetical protein
MKESIEEYNDVTEIKIRKFEQSRYSEAYVGMQAMPSAYQ